MFSIFSYVYWPFVCPLWRSVYLGSLPIFESRLFGLCVCVRVKLCEFFFFFLFLPNGPVILVFFFFLIDGPLLVLLP